MAAVSGTVAAVERLKLRAVFAVYRGAENVVCGTERYLTPKLRNGLAAAADIL